MPWPSAMGGHEHTSEGETMGRSILSARSRAAQRARWLGALSLAAVGIVGCGQLGATGGAAGSPAGETQASSVTSAVAEGTPGPAPRLVVLAGPKGGPYGLWNYESAGGWTQLPTQAQMTAIGRDETSVLLAGPGSVESRPVAGFSDAQASAEKTWQLGSPAAVVTSVARSAAGSIAVVEAQESGPRFLVETDSGGWAEVAPAPQQPFSPLAAWLADGRLLVLSVDARQLSRLCAVDLEAGRSDLATAIAGVRVFAVSPDGQSIAAATEESVYVAAASAWLSGDSPAPAFAIPEGRVVWDLALDSHGRLALLSGAVGADGAVSDVHEVAYQLTGSGWHQLFDLKVPFAEAAGQIWLD
jgi:hypothetical protein